MLTASRPFEVRKFNDDVIKAVCFVNSFGPCYGYPLGHSMNRQGSVCSYQRSLSVSGVSGKDIKREKRYAVLMIAEVSLWEGDKTLCR
jgi:hypothetical protein